MSIDVKPEEFWAMVDGYERGQDSSEIQGRVVLWSVYWDWNLEHEE